MHRRPMPLQISCQGYRTESWGNQN
jgi:hypothetical protein